LCGLVTDVNGTLAVDGILIDGLAKRLTSLRDRLEIHMLTADTHGRQAAIDELLKLKSHPCPARERSEARKRILSARLAQGQL
jgi:soluble P-type ATPase